MLAAVVPDFESFAGDEMLLLLVCSVLSVVGLVHWAHGLRPISTLGSSRYYRLPLYLAFFIGLLFEGLVVWKWADQQIRDNSGYVLLVFVMGGACLTISTRIMPWLGISLRDDAFEQRNSSAIFALSGAILGVLVTYSFANIGSGPSFWNNVFSSLLATGTLLLILLLVCVSGAATSITLERDPASGIRLGTLMVAESLILGRAVAGDWESTEATARDFLHDGWPAILLCFMAMVIERLLRPTLANPQPRLISHGIGPSIVYLGYAMIVCWRLGWWKGDVA